MTTEQALKYLSLCAELEKDYPTALTQYPELKKFVFMNYSRLASTIQLLRDTSPAWFTDLEILLNSINNAQYETDAVYRTQCDNMFWQLKQTNVTLGEVMNTASGYVIYPLNGSLITGFSEYGFLQTNFPEIFL